MPPAQDIHIHVHVHTDEPDPRIDTVLARLDDIGRAVAIDIITQENLMSDVSLQIAEVQTAVADQRTVIDSAVTAFAAVRSDLQAVRDELAARGVSDEDLALLDSLSDQVATNTAPLAAAIADSPDGPGTPTEPTGDEGGPGF